MSDKKILLSGSKASATPTLGNYLGAFVNWVKLQENYECLFPVVDLHSITEPISPEELLYNSKMVLACYIAAGIDPDKSAVFIQSHVPEHAELAWLLTCFTGMGELSRMTQFKDKSQKQAKGIMAGLFSYPILMAADILLYDTAVVPVGDDQKQHVELTRDIAERMNSRLGNLFVVPTPVIAQVGARIMDLQNPLSKMSKSDETGKGVIYLTDSDKDILKKVKSAVTDSGSVIEYSEEKAGIANLLSIHATLSGKTIPQIVQEYEGKMYGHLKVDTAELVVEKIGPVRDTITRLLNDSEYLNGIMKKGADKARERAQKKIDQVYRAVGFIPRVR